MDYAKLMTQAAKLRKDYGSDENSPIDIFAFAQVIDGLTIAYYPFGDNLSGMCVKGQYCDNLIAINSAMTLGRQRFSLAHEFYHLFYDDNTVSVCSMNINSGNETERKADMFASYFLMPDLGLTEMAERLAAKHDNKLSLDDVIRIEQFFGVSHQAAVSRLRHTPYLDNEEAEKILSKPVRHIAQSLGYSPALYEPSPDDKRYMTYGHYIGQVEAALNKGLVSQGKYEELLMDAFRPDLVYGNGEEEEAILD